MSGKLSDEELLKLAQQAQKTKLFENDIPIFLATFNIEAGDNLVGDDFIYSIYKQWSANRLEFKEFRRALFHILPYEKHGGGQYYFKLDSGVVAFTKHVLDVAEHSVIPNNFKTGVARTEHFNEFKAEFNITPGKDWVSLDELNALYETYGNKLSKDTLKYFLEIYFSHRYNNKSIKEFAINKQTLTRKVKVDTNEKEEKNTE